MSTSCLCSVCHYALMDGFKFCPQCGSAKDDPTKKFSGQSLNVAIRDLFEIARHVSAVNDLDLLLGKIAAVAERLTQAQASSVLLLDETKQHLYFKTAGGEKGGSVKTIRVPVGQGIAGLVAKEGQALLIADAQQDKRFSSLISDDKSGFKTQSILCVPLMMSGEIIGVMEVLNKIEGVFTDQDKEVLTSLAGFAAVSIVNSKLNSDQKNFFANVIEILLAAVETQSKNRSGHCWEVARQCCAIARRLSLDSHAYRRLYYAALLHDVGYIGAQKDFSMQGVPYSLEKIEQLHPVKGAEVVESIQMLKECAPIIAAHHEYYNGSGFPNRLSGDQIPLEARILSFVEAIQDQRTSLNDAHLPPEQVEAAIKKHAEKNSGILFDPQVVQAYLTTTV